MRDRVIGDTVMHRDRIDDLERAFASIRSRTLAGRHLTLLHIGERRTVLLAGRGELPDDTLSLAIGTRVTADTFFRRDPPTPRELEQAIDMVEDEVTRARVLSTAGSLLATTDEALRAFARGAGTATPRGYAMTLDAVEALFQRLASASLGHPGALDGMPQGRESAAALLILREFMHHLGHASILVGGAAEEP